MINMLIQEGGAHPNDLNTTGWGYGPLHKAAEMDNVRVGEALLRQGADPTIKDNNGKTAAEYTESPELHKLLGKRGLVKRLFNCY